MYEEDNEYWKDHSEEELPCKGCGNIWPTDHLKKGYCCSCIEHIPKELLTGNQSSATNKKLSIFSEDVSDFKETFDIKEEK